VVKCLKEYTNEFEKDLKKNSRKNPRTFLPRPGVEADYAYALTLWIGKRK
jgi:hypothetical protein